MAWYDPSSWYAAATSKASDAWTATAGLFAARAPILGNQSSGLNLTEPSNQDVVDYDPSEPYTDRPGNMGCPPGYYTSYEGGEKVCRAYGYDQNGTLVKSDAGSAASLSDSLWIGAGKVSDFVAAPFKAIKKGVEDGSSWFGKYLGGGLLKGSYAVIGILLAVAVVILMANRFLSRRGI